MNCVTQTIFIQQTNFRVSRKLKEELKNSIAIKIYYLLLKAPKPAKPWFGIRDALEHGKVCYRPTPASTGPAQSEDCLFLNVYTPGKFTKSTEFSIVFIINFIEYLISFLIICVSA